MFGRRKNKRLSLNLCFFNLSLRNPLDNLKGICSNTLMKKYLVALPCFSGEKGFNHRTILVSAKDLSDCRSLVRHLRPNDNIGDIKEVDY